MMDDWNDVKKMPLPENAEGLIAVSDGEGWLSAWSKNLTFSYSRNKIKYWLFMHQVTLRHVLEAATKRKEVRA